MAIITGIFDTLADAQSAGQELVEQGWTRESISLLSLRMSEDRPHEASLAVKDAERGALIGSLASI